MGALTERIKQFMGCRAGLDGYALFLLLLFFIFRGVARLLALPGLSIVAYVILAFVLFRIFSRNVAKRNVENARFLSLFQGFVQWLRLRRTVMGDKEHRYFNCPNCNQPLRVPRGKGKIQVTCRMCGAQFEAKS